ncbi:hypothetical protein GUITHDRAFT_119904 [Guillardia theta CCMP2712]|uniref:NAD(P)(+)--arginine ADP-ribosyltransferase n=2 Tax=Guillardia theta TaxID=55529 RepID=L1ICE9_GUITC|nr:hypothetical protein GUITHDRAFT_119904 [Guillardia theta CCMP2712]EKX33921.1 hypothetical protein GUITHDRAFT_119904 [Guillardia theta CCMP2712]|eukprot:XP_005820901.1 hypothetical protein GUITHDRAFT_119904 [Guillardia theta CCMP2712]
MEGGRKEEVLALQLEIERLKARNQVLKHHISALSLISTKPEQSPFVPQQELTWPLPNEIRTSLRELFHLSHDQQRFKLLDNDLLLSLGIDVSTLMQHAGSEELSYGDFEVRVAREWEIKRKASSLDDLKILRVMAECIPGGNVESPLAGLQGMTASALSALWQTAIAGRLEEALKRPMKARGDGQTLHVNNSKYSLNESDNAKGSREVQEAVYGGIKEYFGGLIGRIGLPQTELMKGMEEEHCKGKDSEEAFTTSNYNIRTTAKEEWLNVIDPDRRRRLSDGTRVIRAMEELKKLEMSIKAELREEELIALQLYTGTGQMYHKYNISLRAPDKVANRYTTTIHCVVSGVVKLSLHSPLPEDRRVWRGVKGMRLPESFLKEDGLGVSGGVEYGLLSTTTDVGTAIQYAGKGEEPILLEISCGAIDRGASLAFLSQYPGEEEMLFPPLSYLEVLKESRYSMMEGERVKVLTLRINANTTSSTIEEMLGKRKQLYVGLLENIAREVERELVGCAGRIQERLRSAFRDRLSNLSQFLFRSIERECRAMVEVSRGREAEWYNEDSRYKEAIELSNSMKDMAINKLRHWIEDTTGDNKCSSLGNEVMRSVYWRTMAGLMYKISSLTPAGDDVRLELSKRLCGMYGLSISSEEDQAEPPTVRAVIRGQGELIPLLKAGGCDKDNRSRTCAHEASQAGHVEILRYLEETCGQELLREKDDEGRTCAHDASYGGHLEVLEYLAETCGEELLRVKTKRRRTCAHGASHGGHVGVLRYLGETCGKELLRDKDKAGKTCAHTASHEGHLETLRYLAETCGKQLLLQKALDGKTCNDEARLNNHSDVVEYLQSLGTE